MKTLLGPLHAIALAIGSTLTPVARDMTPPQTTVWSAAPPEPSAADAVDRDRAATAPTGATALTGRHTAPNPAPAGGLLTCSWWDGWTPTPVNALRADPLYQPGGLLTLHPFDA